MNHREPCVVCNILSQKALNCLVKSSLILLEAWKTQRHRREKKGGSHEPLPDNLHATEKELSLGKWSDSLQTLKKRILQEPCDR